MGSSDIIGVIESCDSQDNESETRCEQANQGKEDSNNTPQKNGRRGDPRMNRAFAIRLSNPSISLFEALRLGGFEYATDDNNFLVDSENVTLGQRKNQLGRRLRLARQDSLVPLKRESQKKKYYVSKTKQMSTEIIGDTRRGQDIEAKDLVGENKDANQLQINPIQNIQNRLTDGDKPRSHTQSPSDERITDEKITVIDQKIPKADQKILDIDVNKANRDEKTSGMGEDIPLVNDKKPDFDEKILYINEKVTDIDKVTLVVDVKKMVDEESGYKTNRGAESPSNLIVSNSLTNQYLESQNQYSTSKEANTVSLTTMRKTGNETEIEAIRGQLSINFSREKPSYGSEEQHPETVKDLPTKNHSIGNFTHHLPSTGTAQPDMDVTLDQLSIALHNARKRIKKSLTKGDTDFNQSRHDLAMSLYQADNRASYQRAMLLSGYRPENALDENSSTEYLLFALSCVHSEANRLHKIFKQQKRRLQKLRSVNDEMEYPGTGSSNSEMDLDSPFVRCDSECETDDVSEEEMHSYTQHHNRRESLNPYTSTPSHLNSKDDQLNEHKSPDTHKLKRKYNRKTVFPVIDATQAVGGNLITQPNTKQTVGSTKKLNENTSMTKRSAKRGPYKKTLMRLKLLQNCEENVDIEKKYVPKNKTQSLSVPTLMEIEVNNV